MTKTTIIAFAEMIANVSLDADTINVYFSDILNEWGKNPSTPLVDVQQQDVTAGTATYSLPDAAVKLLHLFYEGTHLASNTESDLDALSPNWKSDTGDPREYTRDKIDEGSYRVYPIPTSSTGVQPAFTGEFFGEDYPPDSLAAIISERREEDIPDWFGVGVAFDINAREFLRPSNHQDVAFATVCKAVARITYQMAGIL